MINGRIFETGDNVRPDDSAEPCILAEVRIHSVVLRHRGQVSELKYTAAAPGIAVVHKKASPAHRRAAPAGGAHPQSGRAGRARAPDSIALRYAALHLHTDDPGRDVSMAIAALVDSQPLIAQLLARDGLLDVRKQAALRESLGREDDLPERRPGQARAGR